MGFVVIRTADSLLIRTSVDPQGVDPQGVDPQGVDPQGVDPYGRTDLRQ